MTTTYQQSQPPVATHCPDCGASENPPGLFCANCFHMKGTEPGLKAATFMRRLGAFLLEIPLFFITLGIGYIIWWLIALANGQTPGKQLVGIRAVKANGQPLGWGMTFVREFIVKLIIVEFIASFTFYIFFFVNYLFPLFDKNLQAIHDKIVSSVVVRNDPMPARMAQQAQADAGDDPWRTESGR